MAIRNKETPYGVLGLRESTEGRTNLEGDHLSSREVSFSLLCGRAVLGRPGPVCTRPAPPPSPASGKQPPSAGAEQAVSTSWCVCAEGLGAQGTGGLLGEPVAA